LRVIAIILRALQLKQDITRDRAVRSIRVVVGGTTPPNTNNDKSVTLNTTEMQATSVSSSDETITVKIMKDTLSDLE